MMLIDASALVKLVLNEKDHQQAREIFEKEIASRGRVATINLALAESINTIWKYHTLRKELTASEFNSAVDDTILIFDRLEKVNDRDLAKPASLLAARYNVSVYDAFYLAASIITKAPFLTFDTSLIQKAEKIGVVTVTREEQK